MRLSSPPVGLGSALERVGPADERIGFAEQEDRIRRRRCRARAATPSRAPRPSWPRRGRVRRGPLGERARRARPGPGPRARRRRSLVRSANAVTTMSPTAGASARIMPATSLSRGGGEHERRRGRRACGRARRPAPARRRRCARRRAARAARRGARRDRAGPASARRRGRSRRRARSTWMPGVVERLEQRHRDERVGDLVLAGEGEPHRAVGPRRRVERDRQAPVGGAAHHALDAFGGVDERRAGRLGGGDDRVERLVGEIADDEGHARPRDGGLFSRRSRPACRPSHAW